MNSKTILVTSVERVLKKANVTHMPMLLATDSSFHIGFKSINVVTPAELGSDYASAEWLVATTVIEELDIIGKANQRNRSKIARAEKAILMGALDGGTPLASGVAVHHAQDALDVAQYGLDPSIVDHRIIASYLRYLGEHPDAVVALLTDDGPMRIRARGLGFYDLIDPPASLARPPIKDDVELELERTRAELKTLRAAAPKLSLADIMHGHVALREIQRRRDPGKRADRRRRLRPAGARADAR
jgi:hypothetical protein